MTTQRLLLFAAAAVVLSGCASLGARDDAPVCDGRHRRPANPHGSTLVATPAPAPPTTPGAAPSTEGGCA